jgi:hypothetical protein
MNVRVRKAVAVLLAVGLVLAPVSPVLAQSGGNCSAFRSWITGDS